MSLYVMSPVLGVINIVFISKVIINDVIISIVIVSLKTFFAVKASFGFFLSFSLSLFLSFSLSLFLSFSLSLFLSFSLSFYSFIHILNLLTVNLHSDCYDLYGTFQLRHVWEWLTHIQILTL